MNRKGFVATYIVDFYAYLVFVAIVIVFFLVIAFMPPPTEGEKITNTRLTYDTTMVLIRALQTPINLNGKIQSEPGSEEHRKGETTPTEIIQQNNWGAEKEFTQALTTALSLAYPSKDNVQQFWMGIYPSNKLPKDLCQAMTTTQLPVGILKVFTLSPISLPVGIIPLFVIEADTVSAFVHLPMKDSNDYVSILLCIGGEHFK